MLSETSERIYGYLTETYSNGQVITTSQLSDLTDASERGTHNDSVVAKLLVVVENGLDGGNTRVLLLGVLLLSGSFVPIEDTANEGGNEVTSGLGGTDGLGKREHKSKVAVDAVVFLKNTSGLDALPGGGDFDQDTLLRNSNGFVQLETVRNQ